MTPEWWAPCFVVGGLIGVATGLFQMSLRRPSHSFVYCKRGCMNAIEVESTVTGERVATWCPDCQRRWYYLPYISGKTAA